MVPAILSLQRSLDKGRNSKTIQWDTMRGIRSGYSNVINITPAGTGGAVLSDGRKSTRITDSPTNGIWFQRFMDGCHERMGDVRIPDTALTVDVLLELDKLLEALWHKSTSYVEDGPSRFELAITGCLLAISFSSGLRGEELGHICLRKSILLTMPSKKTACGHSNGRSFQGRNHKKKAQDPVDKDNSIRHSKLHMVDAVVRGLQDGRSCLLAPSLRFLIDMDLPVGIRHLDTLFHKYLLDLQTRKSHLFLNVIDILNGYSVQRSLRRGLTTQAWNKKVP
ncbi:hypothetical protein ACA910_005713 [Epithemia clementina (nom. ined.)]